MATSNEYRPLIVESFEISSTSGHRDPVQIRPVRGQIFPPSMLLECSRKMVNTDVYPVGTKFKVSVRLKKKLDCKPHLYCYHGDEIVTISDEEVKKLLTSTKMGSA